MPAMEIPAPVLWKTRLLFHGVRYTEELTRAVQEGAAPNYWPHTVHDAASRLIQLPIPYLLRLDTGSVARVRINEASRLQIRRGAFGRRFVLWEDNDPICPVEFIPVHAWQSVHTSDGFSPYEAGVEQVGDLLVVNIAPGCEYHRARSDAGTSLKCSFCGQGRFGPRSLALGQVPGEAAPRPRTLDRLYEVLRAAAGSGEVRHVYITGGCMPGPDAETQRYLPVVETCRRAVGTSLAVTCGSGAVDRHHSRRLRDAGADSCCYNLETWDAAAFRATLPGKARYVGHDRWIAALLGAVEVFGWGRVASSFVPGIEMLPPARPMSAEEMIASIREGAAYLLDHGIMPLYSPLSPVAGTAYRYDQGLQPEVYLRLELEFLYLRRARHFPVPAWLTCSGCSHALLEVDLDRANWPAGPGAARQ